MKCNLTKIDNFLRERDIPQLALQSMNLDRWEMIIEMYERLEKDYVLLKQELEETKEKLKNT